MLASAPVMRNQPMSKENRPLFPAFGLVAVLLVVGTGIYFAPDQWKIQARQWVGETYRTYLSPSDNTLPRAHPASQAFKAATATPETASPGAALNGPATAIASELFLPMPKRPPEVGFLKPVNVLPETASVAQPDSFPDQEGSMALSSADRPDPADAIDWLLKRRTQKID
jgi:hypothetical protein